VLLFWPVTSLGWLKENFFEMLERLEVIGEPGLKVMGELSVRFYFWWTILIFLAFLIFGF
jgi:hypothetical protein